jgi:radical SAM superfamily enzyme YgiQ (UPF0313 family)
MTRIMLISPAGEVDRYRDGYRNKPIRYAPITLTLLASLAPDDCDVVIVDEKVDKLDTNFDCDLVGISTITGTAPRAYRIADLAREKGRTVVLGGIHPTLLPEEAAGHADAVAIGLAERSWPRLIQDFKRGKLEKFYCPDELQDIDGLPFPRRDLLKQPNCYVTYNTVQATRGCPHTCTFCVVPMCNKNEFFARPVDEVIAEISTHTSPDLLFVDLNPIYDRDYAIELFTALIPLKKRWAAQVTTEIGRDTEMLNLFQQSGCKALFIGMESISQHSIKEMHKQDLNITELYTQLVNRLHDHGIALMGGFIFGFDSDDKDVFERTVEFCHKVNMDCPRYGILVPFPGTGLYQELDKQGRILNYDWSYYDSAHVVFRPWKMSEDELQEGFHWARRQTFSLWSIFKRSLSAFNTLKLVIPANFAYRRITSQFSRGYNPTECFRGMKIRREDLAFFVEKDDFILSASKDKELLKSIESPQEEMKSQHS